jgi:hypothetical protein
MTTYIFFRTFTYLCVATLTFRRGWYGVTGILAGLCVGALTPEVFTFWHYQDAILIVLVGSSILTGYEAYKNAKH